MHDVIYHSWSHKTTHENQNMSPQRHPLIHMCIHTFRVLNCTCSSAWSRPFTHCVIPLPEAFIWTLTYPPKFIYLVTLRGIRFTQIQIHIFTSVHLYITPSLFTDLHLYTLVSMCTCTHTHTNTKNIPWASSWIIDKVQYKVINKYSSNK